MQDNASGFPDNPSLFKQAGLTGRVQAGGMEQAGLACRRGQEEEQGVQEAEGTRVCARTAAAQAPGTSWR